MKKKTTGILRVVLASMMCMLMLGVGFSPAQAQGVPSDIDGDGCVNVNDFAQMQNNYGGSGTGDVNQDGVVDVFDLSYVMLNFDSSCETDIEQRIQDLEIIFLKNLDTPNSQTSNQTPRNYWSNVESLTGNSESYYTLDYALDGIIAMYMATDNTEYLDLALLLITNMISTASDVNSTGFLEWRRNGGSPNRIRDFKATMNWPKVTQAINARSGLAGQSPEDIGFKPTVANMTYGEMGEYIADFVDVNILQKWLTNRPRGNASIGWSSLLTDQDDNTPGDSLRGYWSGEQTLATRVALETYRAGITATRGPDKNNPTKTWRDFAQDMLVQFKEERSTQPGEPYLWNIGEFDWDEVQASPLAPDTSHYNRTAHLMTRAFDSSLVITNQDISDLARTFNERIWNGVLDASTPDGVDGTGTAPDYNTLWFNNYIDGQDAPYGYATCSSPNSYGDCFQRFTNSGHPHNGFYQGMSGWVYDGWCDLGKYSEQSQQVCAALLDFTENGPYRANAIKDRNGSVWGSVALPGHLAKNLKEKTW